MNTKKYEELLVLLRSHKTDKEILEVLSDYHENDIADMLAGMNEKERKRLYRLLGTQRTAEIFAYLDEPQAYFDELSVEQAARIDYADCRCVCSCLIAGLFCYFAFRRNRKINCYNFMLFLTGRYGILWDFASHVSKSPDMIIKTAALNVIPLTPGLISKTTCAAFLNQFHPFLVRTFGMPLNHSCPTPLLCTMSILDKQHFTLNQTCPMS